jgi:hypothetical protein
VRGGVQVGRAADERRDAPGDLGQHAARRHPGRHAFRVRRKDGNAGVPVLRQFAPDGLPELLRRAGMGAGVRIEKRVPLGLGLLTPGQGFAEMGQRFAGDQKIGLDRPPKVLLRQPDLVFAKRRAVSLEGILFVR